MKKIKVNKELFRSLNELKKMNLQYGELTENECILEFHARNKLIEDKNVYKKELKSLYDLSIFDLALILEYGYELERSKEEEELFYFYNLPIREDFEEFYKGIKLGVINTLKKLKIEIEGINA